ncbi:hypothetical protein GCM10010219_04630 [Streptomyces netropsis]|nr:hypothetical protein GCM10010219_04630 [Streptomyces netropsis]
MAVAEFVQGREEGEPSSGKEVTARHPRRKLWLSGKPVSYLTFDEGQLRTLVLTPLKYANFPPTRVRSGRDVRSGAGAPVLPPGAGP